MQKVRKCNIIGWWDRGLASRWYSSNNSDACLYISVGWVCTCLNRTWFLAFHIDHAVIDHTLSSFLSNLPIICRACIRKLLAVELLFCNCPFTKAHTLRANGHSHKMWHVVSFYWQHREHLVSIRTFRRARLALWGECPSMPAT